MNFFIKIIYFLQELDTEKQKNIRLELTVSELKKEHDQILRVMEMMKKELDDYKKIEEEQRTNLAALR